MMLSNNKFRLPKDIPLEEYPTPDTYLEEGRRLITEAQKQGIILRVMGPIALHYHFPEYVKLYQRLERLGDRVFTDIDYAAYSKHRGKIVPFFERQGYEIERRAAMLSGGERHIFFSQRIPMIDVFYDRLNYNHPIDYRGRLEIHPFCVSHTDLLLQKLQIVQINDKDVKDAILLCLAAPIQEVDQGGINLKYLGKLMSDDWGFYYTSTMNLNKLLAALDSIVALEEQQRVIIREKVTRILQYLESTPKSGNWINRAKAGTSKLWYKEVTDWS